MDLDPLNGGSDFMVINIITSFEKYYVIRRLMISNDTIIIKYRIHSIDRLCCIVVKRLNFL